MNRAEIGESLKATNTRHYKQKKVQEVKLLTRLGVMLKLCLASFTPSFSQPLTMLSAVLNDRILKQKGGVEGKKGRWAGLGG